MNKHTDHKSREKTGRRTRLICLIFACFSLVGCSLPAQSNYPEVPAQSSLLESSSGSLPQPDLSGSDDLGADSDATITLRVAGSWSAEQLDLLGRYYELTLNQVSTLAHEDSRGNHISLDYLSAYESDLHLVAVPLAQALWLTDEQARAWTAAGDWPDLVLTDHYSAIQANQLLDLTPYLMDDKRLSADKVSPALLSASQSPQGLLYLPWRISVPVLLFDPQAVPESAPVEFDQVPSWQEFVEHCHRLGPSTENRLVLANPEFLLPVLPLGQDTQTGWTGWDGSRFDFTSRDFTSTATALRHLVEDGATGVDAAVSYPDYQLATQAMLGANQVAYQAMDSSQLVTLSAGRSAVQVIPLPRTVDGTYPYPVNIKALSVSKSTGQPELASQVAAFLAADPDALYLQNRLKPQPGLFPIIRDRDVWAAFLSQVPGRTGSLDQLPDLMERPAPGGSFTSAAWPALYQELAGPSAYRLLTESEIDPVIQSLQQLWDEKEG